MVRGIFCQFCAPRVNDDAGLALHSKLLELGSCDRVGIGRIGANYQDALGMLAGPQLSWSRHRCRKCAACPMRWANDTLGRTAIDVVGTDHCAEQLLHEVVFFIRAA